jgi:pantothenate kinase
VLDKLDSRFRGNDIVGKGLAGDNSAMSAMPIPPEHLSLTPDAAVALVATRARALAAAARSRVVVGLIGGPGAGKSTIAQRAAEMLNAETAGLAANVPMDGFHMRQAKLVALGTAHEKGMPHTFEAAAFADFLARLKVAREPVAGPAYSRQIEDVVDDAFVVPAAAKILITEGNYLLLPDAPWAAVRPLLDLAIFVHIDREKVRQRLMRRHAEAGLFTEERNREWINRVDLPNYDLIETTAPRADLVIDIDSEK